MKDTEMLAMLGFIILAPHIHIVVATGLGFLFFGASFYIDWKFND